MKAQLIQKAMCEIDILDRGKIFSDKGALFKNVQIALATNRTKGKLVAAKLEEGEIRDRGAADAFINLKLKYKQMQKQAVTTHDVDPMMTPKR